MFEAQGTKPQQIKSQIEGQAIYVKKHVGHLNCKKPNK